VIPDPLAGTPYRTLRPLGAGAMGEVVEAEQAATGRRVVVKLLHRHLLRRDDLADRMRLEAESLAHVTHPNVVAVLDHGRTADGRPYLVMERLHGRTLRDELSAQGRLPAPEAVALVAQALDGLSAVHAAGIVHRDIKLDNLFACDPLPGRERVVKLLDLGVAKVFPGKGPAPLIISTEEGVSMGTPRFFSPEQATGAPLDGRCDVYAMGLVLYALMTGRTPFDHLRDVDALLAAHAETPPVPPSRLVEIPAALDAAILKALAKQPADRFATAAAFAAELRRLERAPARATRARAARLIATALAVSFALSMAATAIVHALR
jgi:serine/threonine-protein kinase